MGGMMAGQWIGQAISGIGRVMGDKKRNKEYKKYQAFLRQVYSDYVNDPGRKEASNFVYKLLSTGDYQDIFRNALLEGLERNKANILAGERAMRDRAARGGFLRGGQIGDLEGRAREAQFAADRQAYRDYGNQQFGAKSWAAGQADEMAKGPFGAAMQVAYPMNINPYTGYVWNEVANAGQVIAGMFGGQQSGPIQSTGQRGQQNPQQYMPQGGYQYSAYGPYAGGYQFPQQQQSPMMDSQGYGGFLGGGSWMGGGGGY